MWQSLGRHCKFANEFAKSPMSPETEAKKICERYRMCKIIYNDIIMIIIYVQFIIYYMLRLQCKCKHLFIFLIFHKEIFFLKKCRY